MPRKQAGLLTTIDHSIEVLKDLRKAVKDEESEAMSEHYNELKLAYESLQSILPRSSNKRKLYSFLFELLQGF